MHVDSAGVEPDGLAIWHRAITRRGFLGAAAAGGALLAMPRPIQALATVRTPMPTLPDSVVVRWNQALLQGVRESRLGPPMVSRALAVAHTCMYDAWAAYDQRAIGTRLGPQLRRPAGERTLASKTEAISFAAYRAAVDLFPASRLSTFDPLMISLGYNPGNLADDAGVPAGVGNLASRAVLDARHHDGANQLGDEPGGLPGIPYSDDTGYTPTNQPMDTRAPLDPATVVDPSAWQPLRYVDATGALVTQRFLGAQWPRVTAFALRSPSQLRSPNGPAIFGSSDYAAQAEALLELSAGLTDEQKMVTEYWADGPRSELPPGHWNLFAQFVARRDRHGGGERGVDRDIKLFFALTNAIFDAGIVAWDSKRAFNSVRPITAVRLLYRGERVRAWAGPGLGTRLIDGLSWFPYQPTTFPTPPFPEYCSGHSCFSAAGAEILRRFTGSDHFGDSVTFAAGSSRIEPGLTPEASLTLRWRTFAEAAHQAGISRRYGGIHFEQADLDARASGRETARIAWERAETYWGSGDDGESVEAD